MTKKGWFALGIGAVMLGILHTGCQESSRSRSSADGGDGDTDSTSESGTDIRTGDDSNGNENCVSHGMKVVPDSEDWIGACANDLGLQGSLYTFSDGEGSTIELVNEGDGRICVSGSVVQVPDQDSYSSHYGAGVGFDICKPNSDHDGDKVTLADCPQELSDIVGFSVKVDGTLPTTDNQVRFVFEEKDAGSGNSYVELFGMSGAQEIYFKNATVAYATNPEPMNSDNITGVQVMISTVISSAGAFDFCLSDITMLTEERTIATGEKFIGNITQNYGVPSNFGDYWNQITPENEGKWDAVEGTRDQMNWGGVDRAKNYADSAGIPFKGHALIFGNQAPTWLDRLSASEQAEEIEEWIREYCNHFPDSEMIDVVNEPDHTTPRFINAMGGAGSSGHDWVIWAFEKARQYCGNAVLILNDYNVLRWDTDNFIHIANKVKSEGLLDAVGCQAHSLEDMSFSELQANMAKVAGLNVPIYISEYDIEIADDQQQLRVMQQQFPFFYEHESVVGITLWGYIEGQHWRPDAYLLRSNGTERPALTWLRENYLQR